MSAERTVHISKGLIVIGEDDDDARELLSQRFAAASYDVFAAADGPGVIALLQQVRTPAAVFLDVAMPGILGTSVLDYIRSDPRLSKVPVALVTGSPELAPEGVTLFRKPVHFDELLAFIRQRERHEILLRVESRND